MHGRSQAVRLPARRRSRRPACTARSSPLLRMKCLDTNVVIAVINNRPSEARAWLMRELASGAVVGVPVIVLFEMIYGCQKSDRRAKSEAALRAFLKLGVELWPFEPADAEHAGDIRAHLEDAGTPIGSYDYLIA